MKERKKKKEKKNLYVRLSIIRTLDGARGVIKNIGQMNEKKK